jgi:hypothetical protein
MHYNPFKDALGATKKTYQAPPRKPAGPTMKRVYSRIDRQGKVHNQIREVDVRVAPASTSDFDSLDRASGRQCVGFDLKQVGEDIIEIPCVVPAMQDTMRMQHGWLCKKHFFMINPSRVMHYNDEPARIAAILSDDAAAIAASGLKPLGRYGTGWDFSTDPDHALANGD